FSGNSGGRSGPVRAEGWMMFTFRVALAGRRHALGLLCLLLVAGCSGPPAETKPPVARSEPQAAPEKSTAPGAEPAPPAPRTARGHLGPAYSAAFSPDGKRLASTSADRTAQVWDAATGQHQLTLGGQGDYVNGVAFSPDGTRIAF